MTDFNIHSVVGRTSYGCDLAFRIIDVQTVNQQKTAILYGEDYRLVADAPFSDLQFIDNNQRSRISAESKTLEDQSYELFRQDLQLVREKQEYEQSDSYSEKLSYFQIPGRILHLDGDAGYLQKCIDLYEKIGLSVTGVHCYEKDMPERITELLEKYRPDILVITGHDAYSKTKGEISDISAYRHSKYFVNTVFKARKVVPNLDQLIIFAGACQSHFESLIRAGANFASSPGRVNIHALDPVYIVGKICYTPFMQSIKVWDVLRNTLTGEKGLGGIETRGILRTGMPYNFTEKDE